MLHKTIAVSLALTCLGVAATPANATPDVHSVTATSGLTDQLKKANDATVAAGFNASVVGLRTPHTSYFGQSGHIERPGTSLRGLTTQARFGSLTKLYLATLVMSHIERSDWTLQTTIAQIAPQLTVDRQDVTIEQLLSHRSGIPEFFYAPLGKHTNQLKAGATLPAHSPVETHTATDLLEFSHRFEWQFEPGSQFRYTNANYIVLGELLRAATGKSPNQLLRERITQPLGLQQTWFDNTAGLPNAYIEEFYIVGEERAPFPEFEPSYFGVAGNLVATPAEVTRFLQALPTGAVISKESFAEMTTTRHLLVAQPTITVAYGLGAATMEYPCDAQGNTVKVFGHDGLTVGTSSLSMGRIDGTSAFATAQTGRNFNAELPGQDPELVAAAARQKQVQGILHDGLLGSQCLFPIEESEDRRTVSVNPDVEPFPLLKTHTNNIDIKALTGLRRSTK